MKGRCSFNGVIGAVLVVALGPMTTRVCLAAADSDATMREAAKHFQQGVVLYGEADYRSALVEFKRAGALAPSSTVVYNIAQAQFQLKDYANALRSFDHYLAMSGPSDSHRAEVESNLRVLNARVGRLSVSTVPVGADITIDDEPAGKTPFADPVIVNVGRVKVVATMVGRMPVSRAIDVAAEDHLAVSLDLGAPVTSQAQTTTGEPATALRLVQPTVGSQPGPMLSAQPQSKGSFLRPAGWIIAGVAGAGAVTFGVLAYKESRDLKQARDEAYPTTPGHLDDLSRRTRTYAVIADALAATAIVMTVWTFFSDPGHSTESSSTRVTLGPRSAVFETTF